MNEEVVQLIFAAILILFGMLGSARKKKDSKKPPPQAQRRRPMAPSPAPRSRPQPPRPAVPKPAPPAQPAPRSHKDALVQELERLLGTSVEVDEAGDLPEAVSLESTDIEDRRMRLDQPSARWAEGVAREESSLETLEEAGEKSHDRFHARYMTAAPQMEAEAPAADPVVARLRTAIIWSEILGPPVSLR